MTRQQRQRVINDTLRTLNALSQEVSAGAGWPKLTADSLPGLLPRHQQILIWSAFAVIDRSPVCLVSGVEPVANDEERAVWWLGLEQCATPEQTVALFCLPPLRSLTPIPSHLVLDITHSSLQGVSP
jgi:hypothetical protein